MNDHMHTGIAEATRLTQRGRLDEATAAIQRALGGTFAPAAQEDPGDTNEPIEVISRLVRATPQGGPGVRQYADLARLRGRPLGRPCSPTACNSLPVRRLGKSPPQAFPREDASSSVRTQTVQGLAPTNFTSRAATPGRPFP
jgi:hypothetical protein